MLSVKRVTDVSLSSADERALKYEANSNWILETQSLKHLYQLRDYTLILSSEKPLKKWWGEGAQILNWASNVLVCGPPPPRQAAVTKR